MVTKSKRWDLPGLVSHFQKGSPGDTIDDILTHLSLTRTVERSEPDLSILNGSNLIQLAMDDKELSLSGHLVHQVLKIKCLCLLKCEKDDLRSRKGTYCALLFSYIQFC